MAELNLLPYELKKKRQDKLKSKDIVSYAVLFICIMFTAVYFPIHWLNGLNDKEKQLILEVDRNSGVLTENTKLNQQVNDIKKHIERLETLTSQRVLATEKVKGIEACIPSDVSLTNLSYDKGSVNISAKSSNYNSLCIFAANLQVSEKYKDAKLVSINKDQTSGYTCVIMIGKQGVQ